MPSPTKTLFASRAMDVAYEDGGPRNPLASMFPKGAPAPSLAEALAPLATLYPKVQYPKGTLVSTAIDHVEFAELAEKFPRLSHDDCVAIVLEAMVSSSASCVAEYTAATAAATAAAGAVS